MRDASLKKNTVLAQSPGAGNYVVAGDDIRVVLSNGKGNKAGDEPFDQTTFSFPITIDYVDNGTGSDEIEIYLEDANHSYKNVYQKFNINKDTTMSLTFTLDAGKTGKYKVLRDGQLIAENKAVHQ